MLNLKDVTLVAVFNVEHDLTRMAVQDCTRHVRFGDVKLFTDRTLGREEIQAGPFAGPYEAAYFTVHEVPKHVKTSHALFTQWDAWICNPSAWTDEFLEYDYIGAPWYWFPDRNVGNSGFCLRSKKLIDFMSAHESEFPLKFPEDVTTCREYGPQLEASGFKFAPITLASRFSFERIAYRPVNEIFGFHGQFCWPYVMTNEQIEERMKFATPYVKESGHYSEMRATMANADLVKGCTVRVGPTQWL